MGNIVIVEPFPQEEPPHEDVYHCHVPPVPKDPPVSDKVTDVPEITVDEGNAVIPVGASEER